MNHPIHLTRAPGFAMIEALVSLLLLALAMLGAAAALIQSLAGQRAAILQTIASDLTSSIAETLRASPGAPAGQIEPPIWRQLGGSLLPGSRLSVLSHPDSPADQSPAALPAHVDIVLSWQSGHESSRSQLLLSVSRAPSGDAP